jgi:hypothetical protein
MAGALLRGAHPSAIGARSQPLSSIANTLPAVAIASHAGPLIYSRSTKEDEMARQKMENDILRG